MLSRCCTRVRRVKHVVTEDCEAPCAYPTSTPGGAWERLIQPREDDEVQDPYQDLVVQVVDNDGQGGMGPLQLSGKMGARTEFIPHPSYGGRPRISLAAQEASRRHQQQQQQHGNKSSGWAVAYPTSWCDGSKDSWDDPKFLSLTGSRSHDSRTQQLSPRMAPGGHMQHLHFDPRYQSPPRGPTSHQRQQHHQQQPHQHQQPQQQQHYPPNSYYGSSYRPNGEGDHQYPPTRSRMIQKDEWLEDMPASFRPIRVQPQERYAPLFGEYPEYPPGTHRGNFVQQYPALREQYHHHQHYQPDKVHGDVPMIEDARSSFDLHRTPSSDRGDSGRVYSREAPPTLFSMSGRFSSPTESDRYTEEFHFQDMPAVAAEAYHSYMGEPDMCDMATQTDPVAEWELPDNSGNEDSHPDAVAREVAIPKVPSPARGTDGGRRTHAMDDVEEDDNESNGWILNPDRPVRFRVRLQKDDGKQKKARKLGLETTALLPRSKQEKGALWISRLSSDGLVAAWNSEHRLRQVRPGDYVIEVNGVRGVPDDLYAAISKARCLDLLILRIPVPPEEEEKEKQHKKK
mmetsp:Transcript_44936/g.96530  ORF Transcript_44936/g.96530 Transcript_44936/m.96530 type:complete len:569 (-) Transcript_44936:39-1745(-)